MSDMPPIERPWDKGSKDTPHGTVDPGSGATWDGTHWVKDGQVWTGSTWTWPAAVAGQEKVERTWWRRNRNGLAVVLVLGIVLVGAIVWITGGYGGRGATSTAGGQPDQGDELGAWVVCQQQMDEMLKAPATAEYPSRSEVSIRKSGGTYTVRGWVDSQNGFGALVRTDFICTAISTGGDNYRVTVSPQN
jgi:hypothetical protein